MDSDQVEFKTLGCRLNIYETEAMRDMAAAAGLRNAVVVNTCAVTGEAVRKSLQTIRRSRRDRPDARIIATGCASQVDPSRFSGREEVDLLVGNGRKLLPGTWKDIARAETSGRVSELSHFDDIMSAKALGGNLVPRFANRSRAFVQIQNGCDHRCTFCIIPYGRGPSRSIPTEEVLRQARNLVLQGYKELVLTGVDLTSWGEDLSGPSRLGSLIRKILDSLPELPRLRVSSVDPVEIDPEFLRCIAERDRLMPHLHLSLQSGDNMILKRMKRRHQREDVINLCKEIRRLRPGFVFGADIIAGFPTETDEMFENSLKIIDECGLTWLHVFPFSPRQGTPAALMPQLPRATIRRRAALLREFGQKAVLDHLRTQSDSTQRILMESPRTGRTEGFAEAEFDSDQPVGSIVKARTAGVNGSRLVARKIVHSSCGG